MMNPKIITQAVILFCLILFTTNALGQTAIEAGTANTATVQSSNQANTWEDVGSVSVTLSAGKSVMVLGSIESSVSSGNSDLTCKYRLSDGTTQSPVICRYVEALSYGDYGLASVGYIFDFSESTGAKSFTLQHAKDEPGTQKRFNSKAVLVALVLDDENVTLPKSLKSTGDVTTTSTSFVQVSGTQTDAITLTKPGGIYLSSSFSTFGSEALTAGYVLRSSTDGTNFSEISNTTISRTNSTNLGAATISVLLEDQPAGTYYFDVAHKTSTGTLTTSNLSFCTVGLVDTTGLVFPTFKSTGQSDQNSTTSWENAATSSTTSLNGTNELFVHSAFSMSSDTIINPAVFQLSVTGTGASFTAQSLQRYVPSGGTGSGGIVGLATGLNANTAYTVNLQHQSSGSGLSLTTSNANLVGFQLKSAPDFTWGGASNGAWNTASNWSQNTVPKASNNVSITSGSAVINAGQEAECYNLTVGGSAGLTINSDASSNGSLIVNGTSTGNVTYKRYVTGSDWHLVASPVSGQSINDFVVTDVATNAVAVQDSKYGLATYDNTIPGWSHYTTASIGSSGNFSANATGYEIRRTSGGTVSFAGTLTTSNVSIGITDPTPGNAWNLIGNPFTAAINANAAADSDNNFLTENLSRLNASYAALYVWNASSSSYTTINQTGAAYVAPGQAFFVNSVAGGANIEFTEAMLTHQTGNVFKSASIANPSIKLIADYSKGTSSTHIKYIENTTIGLDPGYDAGRFSAGDNSFAIYSHLVGDSENEVDFDIQCLPYGEYDHVVPIGLNAPQDSKVVIRVENQNLPDNLSVYLEDKETGTLTDLSQSGSHYAINFSEESEGSGRFYVHTELLSSVKPSIENDIEIAIIPRPQYNKLRVIGQFENKAQLSVYDLMGRKLKSSVLNNSASNEVEMTGIESGIYIIKIDASTQQVSKKISWVNID